MEELLDDFRFPFEWQVAKEQFWSNPCFVVAFAMSASTTIWTGYCSVAFVGGEVLSGQLFMVIALLLQKAVHGNESSTSALRMWYDGVVHGPAPIAAQEAGAPLPSSGSAELARHSFALLARGFLGLVPPTLAVALACVLHSWGSLGLARLPGLTQLTVLALIWSLASVWTHALLTSSWDLNSCRSAEARSDVACQGSSSAVFASPLCQLETFAECEFILLIVYVFLGASVVVTFSCLVCAGGLVKEHRLLRGRRGKLTGGLLPQAGDTRAKGEMQALI